MMFVSRDGNGKINGSFSRNQKSIVTTEVPDNDPDLLAYINPPKTLEEQKVDFYNADGLTDQEFLKALMQKELDNDPSGLNAYKTKRTATRAKTNFPK